MTFLSFRIFGFFRFRFFKRIFNEKESIRSFVVEPVMIFYKKLNFQEIVVYKPEEIRIDLFRMNIEDINKYERQSIDLENFIGKTER